MLGSVVQVHLSPPRFKRMAWPTKGRAIFVLVVRFKKSAGSNAKALVI
jgi:hypothetical protein